MPGSKLVDFQQRSTSIKGLKRNPSIQPSHFALIITTDKT